jgi:hypothetical protein
MVFYQSADASAQYIHYKYGPEAGAAAQESVPVAKDMLDGKHCRDCCSTVCGVLACLHK